MLKKLRDWVDDRTNFRQILKPIRQRVLPNGPSWGLTTANCVLGMLVIECVTGLLLMTVYSPSTTSAWASVHYIDTLPGGAFIRGLHFFGGQAMIVLFAVHIIRVLLAAAFRAPHELVWVTGLVLLPVMIIWAITGNPLSGSQKGYSQIEVEGNIIGSTPVVGPVVRRLLIGGDDVGNLTITHLHFLHVAALPIIVGLLLVIHLGQIYRHGLSTTGDETSAGTKTPYFPSQTIRNLLVLTAVLGGVAYMAWSHGAPLDAPADPELPHSPRPEWYFLFLFELRRYFVGPYEFIATIVLPSAALVLLLLMPVIDHLCSRRLGRVLRYVIVVGGVSVWTALTLASLTRDWDDKEHQAVVQKTDQYAARARLLADHRDGIPPQGAILLLREDAKTQGPLLFAQHCASCHSHADADDHGIAAEKPSAPNLYGFATRQWIAGMLQPGAYDGERYFGNTKFKGGDMSEHLEEMFEEADDRAELLAMIDKAAAALSAEASLRSQKKIDTRDVELIKQGRGYLTDDLGCTECHKFRDEEGDEALDLTGYGSRAWLTDIIRDPAHSRFYGKRNDRMPAFAADRKNPANNQLSEQELNLLVDWLRGDWFEPSDETSGD